MNGKWRWWATAFLTLIAVLLFFPGILINTAAPADFVYFLGRFHPLIVHLPIGILILALALEIGSRDARYAFLQPAIPLVILLAALTATFAALSGRFLSFEGGYDETVLDRHKLLGMAIAVLSFVAWFAKNKVLQHPDSTWKRFYPVMGTVLLILVAGGSHLGGTLTHGSGYLTEYLPQPLRSLAGLDARTQTVGLDNPEEAKIYADLIQPIFNDQCLDCHNPDKQRGGLLLDTPEGVFAGGDGGLVVVEGEALRSELVRRLLLPTTHDEFMPPDGRRPVSNAETALIRWWIEQGANLELTLAEADITPEVQLVLDGMGMPELKRGIFALDVELPDSNAIQPLADLGVSVLPLSDGSPFLQIQVTNITTSFGDEQMMLLRPLAPQIAWLDLARSQISDVGLSVVAELPHLNRLHLEHTRITDAALDHLTSAEFLEYLNLYNTGISDTGLTTLNALPALRKLYLWQSKVTPEAAQQFAQSHPNVDLNYGWSPVVAASDTTVQR